MITIVCVKNVLTDEFIFYQSLDSLFENITGIKRAVNGRFENTSIEWVKSEIAENGVASIYTVEEVKRYCGIRFPAEVSSFVVSYMDVK